MHLRIGNSAIKLSLIGLLFIVALFFVCALSENSKTGASLFLNEVCASNFNCLLGPNGDHPDWIELYNGGKEDVSLKGWHISDSERNLGKCSLPDIVLPAGEFIVLYGGEDRAITGEEIDLDASFSLQNYILTGRGIAESGAGSLYAGFKISFKGEELFLSDPRGSLRQHITVPELSFDMSYGAHNDGGDGYARLSPTPGYSNAGAEELIYPDLPEPELSLESGFYEGPRYLSMEAREEGEIHYTLDGSVPTEDSPVYSEPVAIRDRSGEPNIYAERTDISTKFLPYSESSYILPDRPVDKCTVVRAALFGKGGRKSTVVTRSYFIGYREKEDYDGYGIISLTVDPKDLFDKERGIYCIGEKGESYFREMVSVSQDALEYLEKAPETPLDGSVSVCGILLNDWTPANYNERGRSWERESSIAVFGKDRKLLMEQDIGMRIKGNRTRVNPQKSFSLFARECYGSGSFAEPFISGDANESSVTLYTGANDEAYKVKDRLITLLTDGLEFGNPEVGELYHLFLNGEYWGAYEAMEKQDKSYISRHYGIPEEDVVIVKNDMLEAGIPKDEELFDELKHFLYTYGKRFEDSGVYRSFFNMVDKESFLDYFAARIYIESAVDWPRSNIAFWRSRKVTDEPYRDGKWRFLMFDNNLNMLESSVDEDIMGLTINNSSMFRACMRNPEFREDFNRRMEELRETVYEPSRVEGVINEVADYSRKAAVVSGRRWFGQDFGENVFEDRLGQIRRFFEGRQEVYPRAGDILD
ncbi:MAG: CotH kinase family protein [Lachnospiraceae bacterium]|nr:CotH kinase family protein [Lachnospiraceae bacterium]